MDATDWVELHVTLLVVILLVALQPMMVVVEQKKAVIIERFGRFHKVATEGLHFLIPGVDRLRPIVWRETEVDRAGTYIATQTNETYIDMRERLLDFPHQSVITRDNVEIRVHPMALYKLVDPVKVAYEVYDLTHAVEKLVQTTLRSIIGDMGLDDTLASREEINKRLAQKVKHVCHNWGCELTRVELLEIAPASGSIENAMHQQLQAERVRRSNVKRSDGQRIKLKTHAEGNMSAVIAISKGQMEVKKIKAKAEADSKLLIAAAEAEALEDVGGSLNDFGLDPSDYMVSIKYIEAFQSIAKGAKRRTMFVPFESDVIGAAAGLT